MITIGGDDTLAEQYGTDNPFLFRLKTGLTGIDNYELWFTPLQAASHREGPYHATLVVHAKYEAPAISAAKHFFDTMTDGLETYVRVPLECEKDFEHDRFKSRVRFSVFNRTGTIHACGPPFYDRRHRSVGFSAEV